MTTTTPYSCSNSEMIQRGSSAVVLLNIGSYPGFADYLNDTWTWNGTDWTNFSVTPFSATGPLPGRSDCALTYDGYNVVLFGGNSTTGVLADTWTFNGTAWTREAPATVPFGRFKCQAGLIGTAGNQKVVMFGGSNLLNFLNETWVWNGSAKTWTLAASVNYPAPRVDFAFSGGPSSCILFGGQNTNSNLGDTWSFNGTTWTQLTPTTPPSYRSGSNLCYDTANSQWVLFGGANESGVLSSETWTLNSAGTAWTQKAPATKPSGRVNAQMCYDSQNGGRVLLFGGNNGNNTLNDTWAWNGTTWTQL